MRAYKLHDGRHGAALTVRVTPRARRTEIAGFLEDGILRIRIAAPPVEGKANAALVEFLAKVLSVRKNRIEVVAGDKSLDKIISVTDMSADEVQRRVNSWMSAQTGE